VAGDVLELWNQAVSYLNQRNTKERSQIGLWLEYLTPKVLSDSELVVSTDNSFAKERVERFYSPEIKDAIFNVAGIDYGFRVVISDMDPSRTTPYRQAISQTPPAGLSEIFNTKSTGGNTADSTSGAPGTAGGASVVNNTISATIASSVNVAPVAPSTSYNGGNGTNPVPLGAPDTMLPSAAPYIPSYSTPSTTPATPNIITDERTFESFVVGDSNRYAWSAALGVAKSPGNIYNPLFIYGESGLGKTHLLLAIENYIRVHHPYLKTTYADASDLVRDFTGMLYDDKKKREFELKYHRVDVILFDDVQSLEGKVETTNEVFQIFNHFTAQNKQIVLSADRAPKDIDLDTRYKSRFASGITIDIQPPTFETKRAIFENYFDYCCKKIERLDIKEIVTREIIDRIIELSTDNIRELEGATASLVAYLSARENMFDTLTIKEVEQRISSVFIKNPEKRVTINSIQKEVENFYRITHEDLVGKKRCQGITYPRQIAMYLSRNMTSESYPDIGRAFGGKDHTSVMYACNNVEKKRQLSKEIDREIERLISLLKK
jgi:chromosomal replication initiator protein